MIDKFGKTVTLDELTADNYVVPKGEERCYHAVIEVKQFNPRTGERISKPRIQKFGRKMWETTVYDSLLKQGYTIKVLYNPTEYIKAHAQKAAEARAEAKAREAAQRKAEIDEAVAKAKAELLAELKAEKAKTAKSSKKKAEGENTEAK